MSVLFVASEVGSVRALLPICSQCYESGLPFSVVKRGYMEKAYNSAWNVISEIPEEIDGLGTFLKETDVEVVIFSVNVKDTLPLKVARAAEKMKIPTIHVLDYWNAYQGRMCLDNETPFVPSAYVVPDEYARQKAIKEGVNEKCIHVMGQPALADTIEHYDNINKSDVCKMLASRGIDFPGKIVLFVSEPVSMDQGESEQENPDYRGYTEKDTLRILVDTMKKVRAGTQVCVIPHPREDLDSLIEFWKSIGGDKIGRVISVKTGRDLLPCVSAVVGMSSTLLYEAWLLDIPVASIQPNLRSDSLRMITEREDVMYVAEKAGASQMLSEWIDRLPLENSNRKYRVENELHRKSVTSIYHLICRYINLDIQTAGVFARSDV